MKRLALVLLLFFLAGCAVGPDYAPPEIEAPDLWTQELTDGLAAGSPSIESWWTFLGDPELEGLIGRATEGSLTLRSAFERILEAQGRRGIAVGEWFPRVDAGAAYRRERFSDELFGEILRGADNPGDFYDAGFGGTWEIDFFGRIRRQVEQADASLQADLESYRDVLVVLYADVASTYVGARTFQERIRLAQANVAAQRDTLELVRERNRAGIVGDLDVRQAELNLARTESRIPLLRELLAAAIHRLAVLVGGYPSQVRPLFATAAPIPRPPDEVVVGVPADLLRQRPDVRRAERQLAAQTARIGVATADLYPRFALLGTFAFQATDAAGLFTNASQAWSLGPALRWNIFDGGRIRSNIRVQDARALQALTAYEQTVLLAVEDAENALVGFIEERQRREALARSVTAAQESVRLVKDLYRVGLTNFQNVLDMERSLFDQQDTLARSEGNVTQNAIRIYRALGGGWAP